MSKKWFAPLLVIILALAIVFPSKVLADDKYYTEDNVLINAYVNSNGSMDVAETRTMSFFDGSFQGAYLEIPKKDKEYTNFSVEENGKKYSQVESDEGYPESTFIVMDEGSYYRIQWHYRADEDTTRTFTVKYTVENQINVYNDTAELYWQAIGDKWEVPTKKAQIIVHFPGEVNADTSKIWAHGPLNGTINFTEDNTVTASISDLPKKNYFEIRVIFPTSIVPDATNVKTTDQKAAIIKQEEGYRKMTQLERYLSYAFFGVTALVLAALIIVYNKYGKKKINEAIPEYYRDFPSELTPAEVGTLLAGSVVNTNSISATILDLARKKYITIESMESKELLFKAQHIYIHIVNWDNNELKPHEILLMSLLRDAEHSGLSFDKYCKKEQGEVRDFASKWNRLLNDSLKNHGFIQKRGTKLGSIIGCMIPLVIILLVLSFVISNQRLEIFMVSARINLIIILVMLLIFLIILGNKTTKGVIETKKWKALKNYLTKFSTLNQADIPALVLWEKYLVYATVFGISKKVLYQLKFVYPEMDNMSYTGGWYNGYAAYAIMNERGGIGSFDECFNSLQSSINSAWQSAVSNSSSSGSGGGASFGGGGGSGGGGGGAF